MLQYLEHIAQQPFIPALERDELLKLSRYKGGLLSQRLAQADLVRLHRVSTGRRSGQVVLQEITEVGYGLLTPMKIKVNKPRGRGGFLHKYYSHKLKEYAETTWPGSAVQIEDESRGRPADVTVTLPGHSRKQKEQVIAFEVFMTGQAKEVRGIAKDLELFDLIIVCSERREELEALKRRLSTLWEKKYWRECTLP